MTTPPLDLTALRELADSQGNHWGITVHLSAAKLAALLDRVEELEATRDEWESAVYRRAENTHRGIAKDARTRAEAAEQAVARVEAICQDTDGNWLDPEDECNNVGGILQAVRGDRA